MSVSDKSRKVLWARSGNRCAFCRQQLVVESTPNDAESVVGEECHIVSGAPNGPRFDPTFSKASIDTDENLILLCATHHKLIDDQVETYSVSVVRSIKQRHEKWVEEKLRQNTAAPRPIEFRRIAENVPKHLVRVLSGKELLDVTAKTVAHYLDHESDLSDSEVELVGGFLQEVCEWKDICGDQEPIEQVRTAKRLSDMLRELEDNGFYAFAAVEIQQIEGGVTTPSNWPVLHLSVLRSTNPSVRAVEEGN